MTRFALFIAVFLCAVQPAAAGAPDKDADYLALVDTAAAAPAAAKWCEIRAIYPETSFYHAHLGIQVKKQTMEAGQKMLMDKTPESVSNFKDFLRKNAAAAGAHFYAAYLYNWNNDLVKQKMEALLPDFGHGVDYINPGFEKQAADALLGCILKTGDGRSLSTAYQVVTVDEEEIIVEKYFKVEPVGIDKQKKDGHVYSIITVQIPDSKAEQQIYFQIDDRLIQGATAAALAGKLNPPKPGVKSP